MRRRCDEGCDRNAQQDMWARSKAAEDVDIYTKTSVLATAAESYELPGSRKIHEIYRRPMWEDSS